MISTKMVNKALLFITPFVVFIFTLALIGNYEFLHSIETCNQFAPEAIFQRFLFYRTPFQIKAFGAILIFTLLSKERISSDSHKLAISLIILVLCVAGIYLSVPLVSVCPDGE
jgi:hypothetical protein